MYYICIINSLAIINNFFVFLHSLHKKTFIIIKITINTLLTPRSYVAYEHQHMSLLQLVSCNPLNPEHHTRTRINTLNVNLYRYADRFRISSCVWNLLYCVPSLMYHAGRLKYILCTHMLYSILISFPVAEVTWIYSI